MRRIQLGLNFRPDDGAITHRLTRQGSASPILRVGLVWTVAWVSGCSGGGPTPEQASPAGASSAEVDVPGPAKATDSAKKPSGEKPTTSNDPKVVPLEYPGSYLDETLKLGNVTVYYFKTGDDLATIQKHYEKMGLKGGKYADNAAAYFLTHPDGSKSGATLTGSAGRESQIILRWDPAAK